MHVWETIITAFLMALLPALFFFLMERFSNKRARKISADTILMTYSAKFIGLILVLLLAIPIMFLWLMVFRLEIPTGREKVMFVLFELIFIIPALYIMLLFIKEKIKVSPAGLEAELPVQKEYYNELE